VYSYRTADGIRWRFVYPRSDGTPTSKRGFHSPRAARDARRRLIEQVERGEVRHTKETFGAYWERWLARRRPYLEPGTWDGYEIAGRKRLMPAFGPCPLGELSVDAIRDFVADLAEAVESGELAPKTVNNALGTLVVCLNDASRTVCSRSTPDQEHSDDPREAPSKWRTYARSRCERTGNTNGLNVFSAWATSTGEASGTASGGSSCACSNRSAAG
jgi:hypothetical protein